jgi:hypothetical protein
MTGWWVVGVVLGITAFGITVWGFTTRQEKPAEKKPVVPELPHADLPKPQLGKSGRRPPVERPAEPKPWTFDAAWREAQELGRELEKDEPQQTAKAIGLLTQEELLIVRGGMGLGINDARTARDMINYGCRAWVEKHSRRAAWSSGAFRTIAKTFWDPATGPEELVRMANVWLTVDEFERESIPSVIAGNISTATLPPKTRNAILVLGGEKWLRR